VRGQEPSSTGGAATGPIDDSPASVWELSLEVWDLEDRPEILRIPR